jgi:peptidoglycan/xylan/chitin deacetylase (PgdA/CDA1 family)
VLALTFDDGPDPRGTPAVLEALENAGVKATFFVLGERVEEHPELLRRVIDEGHEVEAHGFGHLRHPESTREAVARDLDMALDALARVGVDPERWRIPWGHLAEFSAEIAAARQLDIVGWDADTHDWRGDDAPTMLERLELTRGGIVLAHDGIGVGARRETASETAALVPLLVARARDQGLEPGPLRANWPAPIPIGNPNFHPGVLGQRDRACRS